MTTARPDIPLEHQDVAGRLRLRIRQREGRSYAADQHHRGALRVLRPHHLDGSGQVSYTVVNPGGAYFGADEYEIDVEVAADAALLLTTQAATKVYRTPQGPATQSTVVRLDAGAVMESLPDQVIVYRQGSYRQRTHVLMHPEATYIAAEVLTPGWSPEGEAFRYDELRMRTQIDVDLRNRTRVFAVDQLRIVPDDGVTGIGVMEGHSHLGQLLVADRRVDDGLVDAIASYLETTGLLAAVSRIGAEEGRTDGAPAMSGCVVRALGHRTEDLHALNLHVMNLLRFRWRGQGPIHLRKY